MVTLHQKEKNNIQKIFERLIFHFNVLEPIIFLQSSRPIFSNYYF